jgi:hypothetical protein
MLKYGTCLECCRSPSHVGRNEQPNYGNCGLGRVGSLGSTQTRLVTREENCGEELKP